MTMEQQPQQQQQQQQQEQRRYAYTPRQHNQQHMPLQPQQPQQQDFDDALQFEFEHQMHHYEHFHTPRNDNMIKQEAPSFFATTNNQHDQEDAGRSRLLGREHSKSTTTTTTTINTKEAARRARPQTPRGPVATSLRLETLLGAELKDPYHVVVIRVQHIVKDGVLLEEIVLGGGSPTSTAGVTRAQTGPVRRLSSPYRGVSFHSCTQRWRGRIKHGSKSEHLGYFTSDLEAAAAYNVAARKIHGSGAQVNKHVEGIMSQAIEASSRVVERSRHPYASRPPQTSGLFVKSESFTSTTPSSCPSSPSSVNTTATAILGQPYPGHATRDTLHVHQVGKQDYGTEIDAPDARYEPHFLQASEQTRKSHEAASPSMSWEDCFMQLWFDGEPYAPGSGGLSDADPSFGPSTFELDASRCLKRQDYDPVSALAVDCKRIRC
ncbi:AP2-like ethylene-responsive transcription factor AIL1 [Hondaea fermentalgiana]|uniref:AP2-like ethylene-responsive transcription factor AIL1 n=1 Tax=Hondaea fermentalgiana TaxID=2315210 RepID=A0A2R5GIA1_9STRA|nr:AP2-like ethylene-responsive transcription factor AIL1 [Hondaea fermentalgiana]|eukprot:GBG30626.1 AP2-like ethylene-responsive transcription factor AIL1 [Hondaea fermentalgiana]